MKMVYKERGNKQYLDQVTKEVEIMKRLWHPHIIRLYQVFETPKKIFLLLE
jgi:serine/threonine protein kinase